TTLLLAEMRSMWAELDHLKQQQHHKCDALTNGGDNAFGRLVREVAALRRELKEGKVSIFLVSFLAISIPFTRSFIVFPVRIRLIYPFSISSNRFDTPPNISARDMKHTYTVSRHSIVKSNPCSTSITHHITSAPPSIPTPKL